MKKNNVALVAIITVIVIITGVYFLYVRLSPIKVLAPTAETKVIQETYRNNELGFEIVLPGSWKDYSIVKKSWDGTVIDSGERKYSGLEIVIKNPKTTSQQLWQDIPIMVFTHDVWNLVSEEKVAVSAAPIGPAKIGDNAKYVFATPPRWYGFTDAIGYEEAVEIVKTFKTF